MVTVVMAKRVEVVVVAVAVVVVLVVVSRIDVAASVRVRRQT